MTNLGTLYLFELKKICRRKIVRIAAAVMLGVCAVTAASGVLGSYYVDGVAADTHYHMMKTDRAYERALTGRAVDQKLLAEMKEGYEKIPEDAERYTLTEEYQRYARPYSAVFNYIRQAAGMSMEEILEWDADEADFYEKRRERQEEKWAGSYLTGEEIKVWREKEAELQKPVVFAYDEGYFVFISGIYTVNLTELLLVAICLSGVFTEEHARRTDQLLLCSRLGKKELYLAKLLAGVSFAAGSALLLIAVFAAVVFGIYGTDGFGAAVTFTVPNCPWNITAGEAVLVLCGLMVFASVVTGIFVMMLSEVLRHGVGTLAVVFGSILITMFVNIPDQYRFAAQLYDFLPANLLMFGNAFDSWLVKVFGAFWGTWQAAPVLYFLLSALFAAMGSVLYGRYQVSGR